jgi:hypothetical protein
MKDHIDNRSTHYGAAILAMASIGGAHDYTPVNGETNGVNYWFFYVF